MNKLLKIVAIQVHFKLNDTWYIQKGCLAMGASHAVFLANIRLKPYKTALMRDILEMFVTEKDFNGTCPESKKKVTFR